MAEMLASNDESILRTILKLLVGSVDEGCFDFEVLIHINSVFSTLYQLGVGPKEPFKILGFEETWDDFLEGFKDLESVKTYIFLKVQLVIDPPQSSFVLEAKKQMITELEWRLKEEAERGDVQNDTGE